MGNSFGYFEREEDDEAVLKAVRGVLRSKGKLFFGYCRWRLDALHFEKDRGSGLTRSYLYAASGCLPPTESD